MDDLIRENSVDFDSYSSDIEWTRGDFEKARNLIHNLYQARVKDEGSDFELEGVSKEVQTALEKCYSVRKEDILQAVVRKSMLESGVENLVENFDWKIKWVMGTSKMASLREPLLQMNLHCMKESIEFEMDVEKVDALINELEKAKNKLKTEK